MISKWPYFSNDEIELVASQAKPVWKPELLIANNPRSFSPPLYGFKTFGELFTDRQLVALTTFSDLIKVRMYSH